MTPVSSFDAVCELKDILDSGVRYEFNVRGKRFTFCVGSYRLHPDDSNIHNGYAIFRELGITNAAHYINDNFYRIESSHLNAEIDGNLSEFPEACSGLDGRKDKFLFMLKWLYDLVDKVNGIAPRGFPGTSPVKSSEQSFGICVPIMNSIELPSISINF